MYIVDGECDKQWSAFDSIHSRFSRPFKFVLNLSKSKIKLEVEDDRPVLIKLVILGY